MAWLPTFSLRVLDDRLNNNIMLIIVPKIGLFPIQLLQARRHIHNINNRESTYTYCFTCMNGHVILGCVV